MTAIRLSRIHFPVTTLGPGRRVGLWFQGCSIRCPGCLSVDTWDASVGTTAIGEILNVITSYAKEANGLTISGGEPFDQPDALAIVLDHWRNISQQSTLLFTGYDLCHIRSWLNAHPDLVDAVIAGPYDARSPQTLALRGSDNQRLHILSKRGEQFSTYERPINERDRRLDVAFDDNGYAWFAGIPARGDLGRLRRKMATAGHRAMLSDQLRKPVA
jgi:anaerobic ribonucleoside-triphosphate reductase activating protein